MRLPNEYLGDARVVRGKDAVAMDTDDVGREKQRTTTLRQGPKRTENDKGRHRVTCHGLAWDKVFGGEPLEKKSIRPWTFTISGKI